LIAEVGLDEVIALSVIERVTHHHHFMRMLKNLDCEEKKKDSSKNS